MAITATVMLIMLPLQEKLDVLGYMFDRCL